MIIAEFISRYIIRRDNAIIFEIRKLDDFFARNISKFIIRS